MAGEQTLKKKKKPCSMEAAKKAQQHPPTQTLSGATKSRSRRNPLWDRTNDLASSKGAPPRVEAGDEEDAPGTSLIRPLGLDSTHCCDVRSSSGVGIPPMSHARRKATPARMSKGKEVASSSTSSPNRMSNDIRVDRTSDNASSRQAPFLPSADDPQVDVINGDAPGTSFDLLGIDSTPSRDVPSSSGPGVEYRTVYRRSATTRSSKGKEEIPALSTSSHNARGSRIRKRPGGVEGRAVSKSCSIPNRKARKISSEVGVRPISKSCTLPNERKRHHPPTGTDEANESLQEFIRRQKSYFAEIDAFELPEEETSIDDSD